MLSLPDWRRQDRISAAEEWLHWEDTILNSSFKKKFIFIIISRCHYLVLSLYYISLGHCCGLLTDVPVTSPSSLQRYFKRARTLLIIDVSGFAFKQNNIEVYLWGTWVFFFLGGGAGTMTIPAPEPPSSNQAARLPILSCHLRLPTWPSWLTHSRCWKNILSPCQ